MIVESPERARRTDGPRVGFFGIPVDILSVEQTIDLAEMAMETRIPMRHVALNVAKLINIGADAELERFVRSSDLIGVDGHGIKLGLRMFGLKNVDRAPGIDLFYGLLEHCAQRGRRPFVLGATEDSLRLAIAAAELRYPGLEFAGSHHGYFSSDEEKALARSIAESGADCLFVAMPSPQKERFIHTHFDALDVPFVMGVGGSVDVLAGLVPRAPQWMQRNGLEWFHRLIREPRRLFWRYARTNAAYALLLGKAIVYRRNPIKAAPADALATP